jgi:hypothetical protein
MEFRVRPGAPTGIAVAEVERIVAAAMGAVFREGAALIEFPPPILLGFEGRGRPFRIIRTDAGEASGLPLSGREIIEFIAAVPARSHQTEARIIKTGFAGLPLWKWRKVANARK